MFKKCSPQVQQKVTSTILIGGRLAAPAAQRARILRCVQKKDGRNPNNV
jgi:hypothetical protein